MKDQNFFFNPKCLSSPLSNSSLLLDFKGVRLTSEIWHCVKVSKYGFISGPYFSSFGLNTERYEVFGHFLRSVCVKCYEIILV